VLVGETVDASLQAADQLFESLQVAPCSLSDELRGRERTRFGNYPLLRVSVAAGETGTPLAGPPFPFGSLPRADPPCRLGYFRLRPVPTLPVKRAAPPST
jgi:hypothetical protein